MFGDNIFSMLMRMHRLCLYTVLGMCREMDIAERFAFQKRSYMCCGSGGNLAWV